MDKIILTTPLTTEKVDQFKCGDMVLISGSVYTARDAAHKRMIQSIYNGQALPVDLRNQIIYYAGPSPSRPGNISGSFGPTTSSRMDNMTLPILEKGLKGMIGKGLRSSEVIEGIKKHKAVYFAAIGGAGAMISNAIKKIETIAYDDLGTEAIRKLTIKDLPVIVAIDCFGNCIYDTERKKYRRNE